MKVLKKLAFKGFAVYLFIFCPLILFANFSSLCGLKFGKFCEFFENLLKNSRSQLRHTERSEVSTKKRLKFKVHLKLWILRVLRTLRMTRFFHLNCEISSAKSSISFSFKCFISPFIRAFGSLPALYEFNFCKSSSLLLPAMLGAMSPLPSLK